MKYRWFPFLGYKTLNDEEKAQFEIPRELTCKALTFEWLGIFIILVGKVYKDGGTDGN